MRSLDLVVFTVGWILLVYVPSADQARYVPAKAVAYLSKHHYLREGVSGVSEALRELQAEFGLRVTGEYDYATEYLMNQPRCEVLNKPAPRTHRRLRRFALFNFRWMMNVLTYSIERRGSEYTTDLSNQVVESIMATAFRTWSDVTPLKFRRVSPVANANIQIRFARREHGDRSPFDGRGGTLAHTLLPERYFPTAQIHFDEDEFWTINDRRGAGLLQIAMHEIGHALGMDHSEVRRAIMFALYLFKPVPTLDNDDIRGIQELYGPKPIVVETTTVKRTTPTTPTTTTTTSQPRRTFIYNTASLTTILQAANTDYYRPTRYNTMGGFFRTRGVGSGTSGSAWVTGRATAGFNGFGGTTGRYNGFAGSFGSQTDQTTPVYPAGVGLATPRYPTAHGSYTTSRYGRYPRTAGDLSAHAQRPGGETNRQTPGPLCLEELTIDAVVSVEGVRTTYIFRGAYYYLLERDQVAPGYPRRLGAGGLAGVGAGVDAAFSVRESLEQGELRHVIYLLKGDRVWKFDADLRALWYPNPSRLISETFTGLPSHIDSAFYYKETRSIYFFKGYNYYRIHHNLNQADDRLSVETGYPKPLSNWQLPPEVRHIDAVFTWEQNFRSYFFSGTKYYRFDDTANSVDASTLLPYPRQINQWWLGCYDVTVSHSSSGNSVSCSPEIEALDVYGIMQRQQTNSVIERKDAECRVSSNIILKTLHRATTSNTGGSIVYDTRTMIPCILLGIFLQWISRYLHSSL